MIIYISMLVMTLLGYYVHSKMWANQGVKNADNAKYTMRFEAILLFSYIIFWIGMRDSFIDTQSYVVFFERASWATLKDLDFTFGAGWGFTIIEVLFKECISDNPQAWLFFLAAVSGFCLAYTFRRYSNNFYYTVFLFLASVNFTWMMNGIRQFLAVAILFACTPLLEKKRTVWLYCLAVLLCIPIHATCIMMLPIAILSRNKPWSWKSNLVLVALLAAAVFSEQFTSILDAMMADTAYSNSSQQFLNDDGVNPLRVLVYAITPIIAFWGRKKFNLQNNKMLDIFVNMSILSAGLYAVGMVTSGILIGRLPIYIQMYEFIVLPDLIEQCFEKRSKDMIYFLSIAGFLAFFFIMTRGFNYSSVLTGII